MKTLDKLSKSEMEKLIAIIGNGVRPIKAANLFFPDYKYKTNYVKDIRNFCWNKITALNMNLHYETRNMYMMIANKIHFNLPISIQNFDFSEFLKGE